MNADLVCAAGEGQAADHAGATIEAEPMEDRSALLTLGVDPAEA